MIPRLASLVMAGIFLGGSSCPWLNKPDGGVPFDEGTFPAGFIFGVSTAGFQVEPGCPSISPDLCEDHHSDWYQFLTEPEFAADTNAHITSGPISTGPGFYELYPQDIQRARDEVGAGYFRLGLEWSRIFPNDVRGVRDMGALQAAANPEALAFYHAVLAAVLQAGMKPLVTINHYTLPLWIHDGLECHRNLQTCTRRGWLDASIADELATFSGFVAREFGAQVDMWATQNEPMAVVIPGYVSPSATRSNPPAKVLALPEAKAAMANMQLAHARQYDAVKAGDTVDLDGDGKPSMIGIVYNIAPSFARNPDNPGDQEAALNVDYLYNRAFLNGVIRGDFDPDLDGIPEHREDVAGRMDYLGINYYTRVTVQASSDGQPVFPDWSPYTAFDPFSIQQGEDYPKGIYDVAMWSKEYNIPLFITENGKADPLDSEGSAFLVQHLTWLARAIRDGADVRGYFWWSLVDNLEWNHGMDMKFGLFGVDEGVQKTRTARRTVATLRAITREGRIPAELMAQYPAPE